LTAFIYPTVVSWEWGGGYLDSEWDFSDFAGSTLVHSTGGWAALIGAIIIGPRAGKYFGEKVNPMPGSNIPLAALGTFILWFGWFGFNGASQLAAGTFDDINAVAKIFANTNMAAVGGVLSAMILTAILYKGKVDPTMAFNGAIGGLVSITAEPLMPSMGMAVGIGAIGGVLVVLTGDHASWRFDLFQIVAAIERHQAADDITVGTFRNRSHRAGRGVDRLLWRIRCRDLRNKTRGKIGERQTLIQRLQPRCNKTVFETVVFTAKGRRRSDQGERGDAARRATSCLDRDHASDGMPAKVGTFQFKRIEKRDDSIRKRFKGGAFEGV
ncbi:MAG: hypothetical protein AAFQ15_12785, partial [Pseudomonadota bacterium]